MWAGLAALVEAWAGRRVSEGGGGMGGGESLAEGQPLCFARRENCYNNKNNNSSNDNGNNKNINKIIIMINDNYCNTMW